MTESIELFSARGHQRAMLYRHGSHAGVRTALWVSLAPGLSADHPLTGLAGLWLAEPRSGLLGCFGSTRSPSGQSVGGRVLHGLPVLDPDHRWTLSLARALCPHPSNARQTDAELATLRRALAAFRDELDPATITALRAEVAPGPDAYNHYVPAASGNARNRVQAALAHPSFATRLRQDWRLRRAVDTGRR